MEMPLRFRSFFIIYSYFYISLYKLSQEGAFLGLLNGGCARAPTVLKPSNHVDLRTEPKGLM